MKKISIVIVVALLLVLYGIGSQTDKTDESLNGDNSQTIQQSETSEMQSLEETPEDETVHETTPEEIIDSFVEGFNSDSSRLTFVEDFTPSDSSNAYYRVEFRLAAYQDAVGKAYLFGNAYVDIIARKDFYGEEVIRIYMSNATFEQCIEMIKIGSPLIDGAVTDDEIQEAVDYITEHDFANGYYYADLGITLSGDEETGYKLMLKND